MQQLLSTTSHWFKPYLTEIAFSFVATLLILYGCRINSEIKKITSNYHFLVRVTVFILISGFGYGWATVYLTGVLEKTLQYKTGNYLGLIVIAFFLALGIMADNKNHI